jgi:hypothetical protein
MSSTIPIPSVEFSFLNARKENFESAKAFKELYLLKIFQTHCNIAVEEIVFNQNKFHRPTFHRQNPHLSHYIRTHNYNPIINKSYYVNPHNDEVHNNKYLTLYNAILVSVTVI